MDKNKKIVWGIIAVILLVVAFMLGQERGWNAGTANTIETILGTDPIYPPTDPNTGYVAPTTDYIYPPTDPNTGYVAPTTDYIYPPMP